MTKEKEKNQANEKAIKRWKELGIERCVLEFNCGGDSMGDTDFIFYGKDDVEIKDTELEEYFEEAVYDNVEFYVNSDGHYIGESGTVEITLNEEDEEDEPFFEYSKSAQSEWSEQTRNVLSIKLTPDMVDFINKNVSNINGSQDGFSINYKRDFILSDTDEKIHDELQTLIETETEEYQPEEVGDDVEDRYTFTTADDEDDETNTLVINDGMLLVNITNSYTDYRDSED